MISLLRFSILCFCLWRWITCYCISCGSWGHWNWGNGVQNCLNTLWRDETKFADSKLVGKTISSQTENSNVCRKIEIENIIQDNLNDMRKDFAIYCS